MIKKAHIIIVQGDSGKWSLNIMETTETAAALRADGFDIGKLMYSVPMSVTRIGLTGVWWFFEDLWNFRSPFNKRQLKGEEK